ncbi:MAG: hypothetical protein ACRC9T_02440, partial [Vibrionaceae bacterium]
SNPAHQASAIQAVSPQSEPTSHTPAPEQAPAAAPQQAAQQPVATAEDAITALFLENIPGLQLAPLNPDTRVDLSTVKCLHRGSRFDFSMAMRLSFNAETISRCENETLKYLLEQINKETQPYVRLRLLVLAFVRFYNAPKINRSRCAELFGMPTTTISSWCEDFLSDNKYKTKSDIKNLIEFMSVELKNRGVTPSQTAAPRRMPQPLAPATATTTRAQTTPEHPTPLQQLLTASPKVPMPHQLSNLPAIPSAPSVHREAGQHLGPRPKPYSATLRQKPIQPRPQQPQKTAYVLIAQQELQQLQQQLQQQQEQLRQQQLLLQQQQLLLQQLQAHQPPQLPTVVTFIPQPQPQQPIPQAQTVALRFAPQPQQAQQAQQQEQEQEQEQMEQEEDLQARTSPEVAHSPQIQPKEHKE